MEADWAVEIHKDAPLIVVPWTDEDSDIRYVDLRASPDSASEIPEAKACPALQRTLEAWNAPQSAVFTSKCDLWNVPAADLDPLEMELDPDSSLVSGLACYIDVLLREPRDFANFDMQETWLRALCAELRGWNCPGARADFVIRQAIHGDVSGYASTLYVVAAGATSDEVQSRLERALDRVATLVSAGPRGVQHLPL